jgi:RNA polymerase sigma-70 factor (ECF subfamily)
LESVEALLARYQQGDAEAFRLLLRQVSPRLLGWLRRVAGPAYGDADDLLQETWMEVHRARATWDPKRPALPWLFALARHVVGHHFRARGRRERREEQASALPQNEPASPDLALDARALLGRLPDAQREVVMLLKYADLSVEEAAAVLGISVGAVKQKAHRAYVALREALGEDEEWKVLQATSATR